MDMQYVQTKQIRVQRSEEECGKRTKALYNVGTYSYTKRRWRYIYRQETNISARIPLQSCFYVRTNCKARLNCIHANKKTRQLLPGRSGNLNRTLLRVIPVYIL